MFERWVVVSARDSPDVDGYCDRLVGDFSDCEERAVEAAHVIEQYWMCFLADQQARFEEVTEFSRLIDAHAIADRVWEDCEDEEDQDADEEEDWEVCDE